MNDDFDNASGQQTQKELERVRQALTELLGRASGWSGIVEMTDNPHIRGAKPFRCDIVINRISFLSIYSAGDAILKTGARQ